jgi:hypothetical protein
MSSVNAAIPLQAILPPAVFFVGVLVPVLGGYGSVAAKPTR